MEIPENETFTIRKKGNLFVTGGTDDVTYIRGSFKPTLVGRYGFEAAGKTFHLGHEDFMCTTRVEVPEFQYTSYATSGYVRVPQRAWVEIAGLGVYHDVYHTQEAGGAGVLFYAVRDKNARVRTVFWGWWGTFHEESLERFLVDIGIGKEKYGLVEYLRHIAKYAAAWTAR